MDTTTSTRIKQNQAYIRKWLNGQTGTIQLAPDVSTPLPLELARAIVTAHRYRTPRTLEQWNNMVGGGLTGSMAKALCQSGIWACTNYTPAVAMRSGIIKPDALFKYDEQFKHHGNVLTLASVLK